MYCFDPSRAYVYNNQSFMWSKWLEKYNYQLNCKKSVIVLRCWVTSGLGHCYKRLFLIDASIYTA